MKTSNCRSKLPPSLITAALSVILGGDALGEKETWQSATPGIYAPGAGLAGIIKADLGYWFINDTDSDGGTGSHGSQAEIIDDGGDKYLKITSQGVPPDGVNNVWADLYGDLPPPQLTPVSIPLTSGLKIAIVQTGTLDSPEWNGYFPSLSQPPCDCVHLTIYENHGFRVAYVFQRPPDYPQHQGDLPGYHEIFLGDHDGSGGAYIRDIYQDFSQIDGYSPVGSQIMGMVYEVDGNGSATLGDIELANNIMAIPINITRHPDSAVVTAPEPAVFVCEATGAPAPTFQWQRRAVGTTIWSNLVNDSVYSGVATRQLTVISTTTAMTGDRFRCRVDNPAGDDYSTEAVLVVQQGVVVVIPKLRTSRTGSGFRLEWDSLTGLDYQVRQSSNGVTWKSEGGPMSGTNGILSFERRWPTGSPPAREFFRLGVTIP